MIFVILQSFETKLLIRKNLIHFPLYFTCCFEEITFRDTFNFHKKRLTTGFGYFYMTNLRKLLNRVYA